MTTATTAQQSDTFDVLAIGEVVVDLISRERVASLSEASAFDRYLGGQVTNVALNVVRLGGRAAVVAAVGEDGFGIFIRDQLNAAGIDSEHLQVTSMAPTTTVIPSRHTETPDFIVHRGSDAFISVTPAIKQIVRHSRIVHTSAFALSKEPARSAVLAMLRLAKEVGGQVSLDPNYHPGIWPDTDALPEVLRDTCSLVDVVKPSFDDCVRLFGPVKDPLVCAERFLEWGVKMVALTMGREGAVLATKEGDVFRIEPGQVEVADVTGAGDAFWAGLLVALLDGLAVQDAACFGQLVAEVKVRTVGPLPGSLDRADLYRELEGKKRHMIVRVH